MYICMYYIHKSTSTAIYTIKQIVLGSYPNSFQPKLIMAIFVVFVNSDSLDPWKILFFYAIESMCQDR